jgi:hypothetical protein
MFWNNKENLPITEEDRIWVNEHLLWLASELGEDYFKNITTKLPTKDYFDYRFSGNEGDAEYLLKKIMEYMNISGWEINLMYYSEQPQEFSEGIVSTPSDNLKGSWKGSVGKYVDKGFGQKEIWIEIGQLQNTESLIATIAHELSHYKLLGESHISDDEYLTDLTAVAYGFGIFISNSLFTFSQWSGSSHQGWKMKRQGYLPDQLIAYAMAWLSKYRNENLNLSQYLNKTSYKYYKQCIEFIEKNPDKINI